MNGYRLSANADQDIEEIWEYIALHNPSAADRQLDLFHEHFARLSANPGLGQRCEDLRPGLRLFPVGNYVVFYYPQDNGIEVAAVIHGARDIDSLFRRGER